MCTNLGEQPSQTPQGGKWEAVLGKWGGQIKYIWGRWMSQGETNAITVLK